MKKLLFTATAGLSLVVSVSNAQHRPQCGSDKAKNYFIKNMPGYKQQLDAVEKKTSIEFQTYLTQKAAQKMSGTVSIPTYTIPVVFHVLHTNGSENVSDASCIAALAQVNKDYARKSSDTTTIDPLYEPLYVNSHLQFVLAKKDPQGNCTTGIVHHYDTNTEWQQSNLYNYKYSTVGTYSWKPERYLNVYVVKNIIGDIQDGLSIGGYTYKPGTSPNTGSDAIVLSVSLLLDLTSRGLSHEIGHWFGLSHTFDGNNGFNLATGIGNICGDDDIADTPKTPGFVSICPNYVTLLDSCDPGRRPNMHNIMDYASCPKMFTQGQTDKMRFSAESSVASRNNLWSTTNLQLVGIINNTNTACAPIADFASNKVNICTGQTVAFNSTSYNSTPTSYSWVFEGGTPSTSSSSSQNVTYNTPGIYSVSLTVSNANGTGTKTSTSYIRASWNSVATPFPYSASFEDGALPSGWYVDNRNFGSISWQMGSYGSQGSDKCLVINNADGGFYQDHIDIVETQQFNFQNTTNIAISFDYSTARKPAIVRNLSSLKFQYSTDCGGTWNTLATPNDSIMALRSGTHLASGTNTVAANANVMNSPYYPAHNTNPTNWVTVSYNSAVLSPIQNKRDVKFRFLYQNNFATAQNIYIDNINISGVVGINELENTIGLSLYPNPTNSSSNIEFTSPVDSKVNVAVYDITGRMVEESNFKANAGLNASYTINASEKLNSGVYFVSLELNNQKIIKKLIIQ